MSRIYAALITLIVFVTASIPTFAQTTASANWPLTDPSTGGTEFEVITSGPVDASEMRLNNTEINQYSGPNNSMRVRIEGNEWPANQTTEIEGVYVEYAVTPNTGVIFHVDSISLGIAGVSINTMKANIYYSTDPDFIDKEQLIYTTDDESGNNYLQRDSLQKVTASPNMQVEPGETIYLRVYPWVDDDPEVRTGKYIALQDVVISGTVESIPVPASVTWPLDSDENPVTSGHVLAEAQSYSDAMQLYNFTEFPTTSGQNELAATIQTKSQVWVGTSEPTDSLYIQYTAQPKFGGTFFVDSLSMYIGAWFTQNIRAEIYYSKDSTFTEKQILVEDRPLSGGELERVTGIIGDTVETGEKLYVRVYPYNTESEGWAKLVTLHNVMISGSTVGVTADPPSIVTSFPESISDTFAYSGGYISSDGGAEVTARGVVWSTETEVSLDDNFTVDGSGPGSFLSRMTELQPGTVYYVRAYATNEAGTSFGDEFNFQTLNERSVPEVTTASIEDIMVKSAQSGGNVTDWGGDSVFVRGMVWSTTETEPTVENSDYSEAGSGLGAFVSTMYPLEANTRYFVRAYATNDLGTGYGNTRVFTTRQPDPDVTKVVALDGSGDYTSVQDAFNDVPDNYTGEYTIFVKKGSYYEKLFLDEDKVNVKLVGEDRDSTILWYDDYAGIAGGTSQSYSVSIDANDFVAENITFQNVIENDKSVSDQQAVALVTNGDRQAYYNVNILGFQDTFYARGSHGTGRIYIKNSYVEGSVDFIFGRNIVLFDSTEIRINRDGGTITAAATEPESKFGFVFLDSKITADSIGFDGRPIDGFYLGRPWQGAPRTVFINSHYPATLRPQGWLSWNVAPALYAEYNCSGPGCVSQSERADFSRRLTDEEAAEYTIENIFSQESNPNFGRDWVPSRNLTIVSNETESLEQELPEDFKLRQNYPNPFNPSTRIGFTLPKNAHINLSVYDLLGRKVATLVNEAKPAGEYEVNFDASGLASGVYFYRMDAGSFSQVHKMLLMK